MLNFILDKKANPIGRMDTGEIMGVEMQVKRRSDLENASSIIRGKDCRLVEKNEDYDSTKKVVTICIMAENLFPNLARYILSNCPKQRNQRS